MDIDRKSVMDITASSIWEDVTRIREQAPLIHNISNYVVMEFNANALLALGASPVMAHAPEEVEEMCSAAKSLVVNIGTLSKPWVESMHKAFETAYKNRIPTVLDPVGAGATAYRTEVAKNIIDRWKPTVIRANASEISAVSSSVNKMKMRTKGVDSILSSEAVVNEAKLLSEETGSIVVVSGVVDYIIQNGKILMVLNGYPLMPKVVGMGCSVSAIVGAFLSVNDSPFNAAVGAMTYFGIAGEVAAKKSKMPGTFKMHFIDALYSLSSSDIQSHLKIKSI